MRELTPQEVIDYGMEVDGSEVALELTAVEGIINDLKDVGTICGESENKCFNLLIEKGYGKRKFYGLLQKKTNTIWGMFYIKIQTEKTAEKIERLSYKEGGSLRFNGEANREGYMEFEIE